MARLHIGLPLGKYGCRPNFHTGHTVFYSVHVFQKTPVRIVYFAHGVEVDDVDSVGMSLNHQRNHVVFIIKNLGVTMVCNDTQQNTHRLAWCSGKMAYHSGQVGVIRLGRKHRDNPDTIFLQVDIGQNCLCTIQRLGHHVAECAIVFALTRQADSGVGEQPVRVPKAQTTLACCKQRDVLRQIGQVQTPASQQFISQTSQHRGHCCWFTARLLVCEPCAECPNSIGQHRRLVIWTAAREIQGVVGLWNAQVAGKSAHR